MGPVPLSTTAGVHSTASSAKLQAWNDHKHKHLTDTALKVAAIVVLALLGAVTFALPFVSSIIPLSTAAMVGLIVAGKAGGSGICASAFVLGIVFDWTNYRDKKQAAKTLADLKAAKVPLALSKYKRLNRYGIISDNELEARKELGKDCKRYRAIVKSLSAKVSYFRLLYQCETHPLESSLKAELLELKKEIEELEREKTAIERRFADFHTSIVRIDPTT